MPPTPPRSRQTPSRAPSRATASLLSLTLALAAVAGLSAVVGMAAPASPQDGSLPLNERFEPKVRRTISPGVVYRHLRSLRRPDRAPLSIHLLEVDLRRARLAVTLAKDRILGKEKTSSMVARSGALAGINGGFFAMRGAHRGDPDGLLVIDGELLSDPAERRRSLQICRSPGGAGQRAAVVWPRLTLRVGGVKLSGINKRRFKNGLVLYTDTFGPSTGTSPAGLEAVVRDGSVAALLADAGDAELPAGGAVLSAAGTRMADLRRLAAVGRPLRLTTTLASRGRRGGRRPAALPLRGCSYISAGPALILRGQLLSRAQQLREGRRIANRRFVGRRHPRTAVGIRRGGRTVLLVTVDGRQEGSAGMSLPELARFLRRQGAREAYNLDGGGSTTMVLKGRVANTPSDLLGRERRVSDALVVLGSR